MDIKQYLKNYDHQHQTALKGERNEEFFKNSSKRYGDEPIIHEFAKVKDEPSREPNFTIGILFLIVMFLSANTFFCAVRAEAT